MKKILRKVRRIIREARKHPKFRKVRAQVHSITNNSLRKLKAKAPEAVAKIKALIAQHGEVEAVAIVIGGLTAVVVGKQLIIIGGASAVSSVIGAGIAILIAQPELALVMLVAAALGAAIKVLGWVLVVAGYLASALGIIWCVARAVTKLVGWWKRRGGTDYPSLITFPKEAA